MFLSIFYCFIGVSRGTSLTILKQFPVLPCHHPLGGNVKDCFSSKYKNNTGEEDRNKFCIGTQVIYELWWCQLVRVTIVRIRFLVNI